ncbi:dolichyl-phosphate-mannose-protein mannosyltransferase [Verticillium alfalfae VaMs.102]|uniref:Dolichyl-phosphate-mannose--protein mannosyltransferase n=1 Tax=Verticillium alfalfae (strain VaMs.102 / ATCC MYA-4576 / FGSC 10136) TaxID=526221 RepID=C9SM65_VERA1|nr:dolichyl-phosphate-mannose-protein mannosyltransferase [Verticillium alfalfae VaMs.102]EEY19880.1 dolichyl-phosphate-mannose-protein mannosyltransferase [Verticillium alfalfae VaMs.102]
MASTTATPQGSKTEYGVGLAITTLLAFVTRFWGISHPNEVVFDEVHFGKFASYYLERTYFFDVHPPFGKLLFAFMGWLVGYDGHFHFDNIGDSYITNKIPYVAFRALPAILGALTVYCDLPHHVGVWLQSSCLSARRPALFLLDNAHIGQTRLILLDATLVLSPWHAACSAYIKFHKACATEPFSRRWWKWLILTGFALSADISVKYVGLFAFVTIGSAVAIDLWELLDVKRPGGALSLPDFTKHFLARAFGLIIMPFLFYLFWFQVHFAILNRSGPGDDFMSPEFQETLSDNVMLANSLEINYYDSLTIRHKETKTYLHSHPDRYPLRYDDGRVSSQGQQITGYPFNDTNNYWQILPLEGEETTGRVVRNHDLEALGARAKDTVFEIRIEHGKKKQSLKSVAMWTHSKALPDWGHKQQEINGNKQLTAASNVWFVEDIPSLPEDDARRAKPEKKVKTMPFLKKWFELQRAMFWHNNQLTSSHPYSSHPYQWPFLLRGVSFWTKNDTRQQIYFLGNPVGWWIASSLLAVFVGIIGADQVSLRRGIDALDRRSRNRLYNSTGFFFLAWATHYFPFYLMGRQLFLHHYLPAHLASCLVAGALLEFIFLAEPVGEHKKTKKVEDAPKRHLTARERLGGQSMAGAWIAATVVLALAVAGWWFFPAPDVRLPRPVGRPGGAAQVARLRPALCQIKGDCIATRGRRYSVGYSVGYSVWGAPEASPLLMKLLSWIAPEATQYARGAQQLCASRGASEMGWLGVTKP